MRSSKEMLFAFWVAWVLILMTTTPTVVVAQDSLSVKSRTIGERFPFSPNTSVRVLAISEKNATALRGHERKSPMLLELEFDAGSEYEAVILMPWTAFVLLVGEQRFPVDHIATHRLDQPTTPPQVFSVTDDLKMGWVITGKAMIGLLFDLPPEAAQSTKKLLEITFPKRAQPTLVSLDK